jgi:hypothetical protein
MVAQPLRIGMVMHRMIVAYFAYRMLIPILWWLDFLVPLAMTTCAVYKENSDLPAILTRYLQ